MLNVQLFLFLLLLGVLYLSELLGQALHQVRLLLGILLELHV